MTKTYRDISYTFSSRIILLVVGIFSQSLLARSLHPSGVGIYAILILYANLLTIIFIVGCEYAPVYHIAGGQITLSEGLICTIFIGTITSFFAIIVGLALIRLNISFFQKASQFQFSVSLILIPIEAFNLAFQRILTAVNDFKLFSITIIARSILNLIFIIFFLYVFTLGINGAIYANITSGSIAILIYYIIFKNKYKIEKVKASYYVIKKLLLYDIRQYAAKLSSKINFQIGMIILAMYATDSEIGYYSLLLVLVSKILLIPDTLNTVLIPKVANGYIKNKFLVAQSARISGLFCSIIVIFLAIVLNPIIKLLFSSKFLPVVELFRITAIGLIIYCTCKVFNSYLFGANHPGLVSFAVFWGSIMNIFVLIKLLPDLGIIAAAVALAVGYITSSIIVFISFQRLTDINPYKILKLGKADLLVIMTFFRNICSLEAHTKIEDIYVNQ